MVNGIFGGILFVCKVWLYGYVIEFGFFLIKIVMGFVVCGILREYIFLKLEFFKIVIVLWNFVFVIVCKFWGVFYLKVWNVKIGLGKRMYVVLIVNVVGCFFFLFNVGIINLFKN